MSSEWTRLESWLRDGKMSRRDFIKKTAALGVAATALPGLLSGEARAATPKKGGKFRLGVSLGDTSKSLDPATFTDDGDAIVNWCLRNNLVEVDYQGNAQPELAESWEYSKDLKTWVFNLRKGVEFHNGKTMDSADVVDSIRYHSGSDSKSASKAVLKSVKEIKPDGKDKVVFELDGGSADFPYILADLRLLILPAGTKEFNKGMGTGGYSLVSFEPGVKTVVKRFPNYFKKDRAHFDEVEILSIPDMSARMNALRSKQVDAINACDYKTIDLLGKMAGIQTIVTTGTRHYSYPMLTNTPPFDNNDVRLALKYAIDREQILKTVFRGYGKVGNDHPIGPAQRFFASELEQRMYDPDKARFHMKKAGLEGYKFNLISSVTVGDVSVDSALLYKEQAKKAGIDIEVTKVPGDGYWKEVWIKKPWTSGRWAGRATADWMFSSAYAAGTPWNETLWNNERFEKLLVAARAELDEKKRRDMYVEMQRIVRDEGGALIFIFASDLHAASDKIRYGNLAAHHQMDGDKCCERWWFEG
jgi:peptide/nickel transport system substrate-binding protein